MSSAPAPPPGPQQGPTPPPILFGLTAQQIAIALFVAGGLCAAIPLGLLIHHKGDLRVAVAAPAFFWGCGLALTGVIGGLTQLAYTPPSEVSEEDKARYLLVALAGVAGLDTVVFGAFLILRTYYDELLTSLESWRANPRALLYPALAIVGGLLLMFLALGLVREKQRTSQLARRLVQGYMAVLGALVLLVILVVVNVLAYAHP